MNYMFWSNFVFEELFLNRKSYEFRFNASRDIYVCIYVYIVEYIASLMSETKFHTYTEPQAKLWLCTCIFKFLCFSTDDEKKKDSGLNSVQSPLNFLLN
jgi:hypothetical protein